MQGGNVIRFNQKDAKLIATVTGDDIGITHHLATAIGKLA